MMRKFLVVIVCSLMSILPVLAQSVEIELTPVVSFQPTDQNQPPAGNEPPRPTDFRATISSDELTVTIENESVPSANVRVTRVSNNSVVLNRLFSTAVVEQMPALGSYVLEIETDGGALIGYFNVQ